jgi:YidC/Oxa1 family membrane protein insertase
MAGPDQLWNWSEYLPGFIAAETGWLGPYFNLLPILTIILFIAQQKIFMPPPTDEQQAMMQKMMSYMMIFMGFLFFKVPAGLCIYFITSSIWGLIERAVIPKPQLSQAILDSIQRDADAPPAVVAKPLAAEGKTQLDEKSRQELRERERERQRRLKDRRKE